MIIIILCYAGEMKMCCMGSKTSDERGERTNEGRKEGRKGREGGVGLIPRDGDLLEVPPIAQARSYSTIRECQ